MKDNGYYLFMLTVGCTPAGRNTEQHDVMFGIAKSLKELKQDILDFWPEAKGKIHVDAWRKVTRVSDFSIAVQPAPVPKQSSAAGITKKLFFINLGGYTPNVFDEQHYKLLVVAANEAEAKTLARKHQFYKQFDQPHVDDKYQIDVDDIHEVSAIMPAQNRLNFSLDIQPATTSLTDDEFHLGYFILSKL